MQETSLGTGRNEVRITRLKDGYTWHVLVAADDSREHALRQAKERALALVRELEDEFQKPQRVEEEVPF